MHFNLFEKACLEWAKAYLLIKKKKDETEHPYNIRKRFYFSEINHSLQQIQRHGGVPIGGGFQDGIGQGAG